MTPEPWLTQFMAQERLPASYEAVVRDVALPLAERIAAAARPGGIVVGICGPQASGKSTLTAVLGRLLREHLRDDGILQPRLGDAGDAGVRGAGAHAAGQHAFLVGRVLRVKDLCAGHGNHAGLAAVGGQLVSGFKGKRHF